MKPKLAILATMALMLSSVGLAGAACPKQGVKELTGAGATFPYPLYSKMFDQYNKDCGVKVNYQSIGSGGGIRQLKQQTVDFGAADAIVDEGQEKEANGGKILHFPPVACAVAVLYIVPREKSHRKCTP